MIFSLLSAPWSDVALPQRRLHPSISRLLPSALTLLLSTLLLATASGQRIFGANGDLYTEQSFGEVAPTLFRTNWEPPGSDFAFTRTGVDLQTKDGSNVDSYKEQT